MTSRPMKVRSALACDDIRTEQDGKFIAIGIINPTIGVNPDAAATIGNAAMALRLHFLLSVDVPELGEQNIAFRTRALSTGEGITMRAKVMFVVPFENGPFPLGPFLVPLKPGERGFVLEQQIGERWKRIATWTFDPPVPSPSTQS